MATITGMALDDTLKPTWRPSSQYRMAEELVDGRLGDRLAELYAQSRSWEQVARDLYAHHRIVVTGQSLRRWADQLGIGTDAKAAS